MVRRVEAFRAGAVFRLRVAAAFRPAATRFGLFLDEVRLRVLAAFRAVDRRVAVFRGRVLAAFRAAVFRLRVAAAFRPAAARFGDFRDEILRAVVRLRPVEVARFAVLLAAVFFRVVAFLVAFRAVRGLVAAMRFPSSDIPGAGVGIGVAVRSGAIMPPCSGAPGRSTVSRSQPGLGGRYGSGIASSCSDVPISRPDVVSVSSSSFHGQVRSDIGMQPPPLCGSRVPYPADAEKMRGNDA